MLAIGDGCAELFDGKRWRKVPLAPLPPLNSTLTGLADGNALLAGGVERDAVAAVSIFDAKQKEWREAAPLNVARFAHAAVRLSDGRVLVSGGCEYDMGCEGNEGHGLDSYELYDLSLDRWELHRMPRGSGTANHKLVELGDGRVLAVGGSSNDTFERLPSQVWDGAQWCSAPPLLAYRYVTGATLASGGFGVVVSGSAEPPGSETELYRYEKECQPACPR